jgi:hypothetical protein
MDALKRGALSILNNMRSKTHCVTLQPTIENIQLVERFLSTHPTSIAVVKPADRDTHRTIISIEEGVIVLGSGEEYTQPSLKDNNEVIVVGVGDHTSRITFLSFLKGVVQ